MLPAIGYVERATRSETRLGLAAQSAGLLGTDGRDCHAETGGARSFFNRRASWIQLIRFVFTPVVWMSLRDFHDRVDVVMALARPCLFSNPLTQGVLKWAR
jgi:hypothetical protein